MKEYLFPLPGARVNYSGQGTVYLAIPESAEKKSQIPAVVAVHGSGRCATDYRDTPFYARQRDLALQHGALFAAVSNGPDTWGQDDGLHNVLALLDLLSEQYRVKSKVALWCTSAGGVTANRIVALQPERVAFVLGTFPVFDLSAAFALRSCKRGWKTEDPEEFCRLIQGRNPASFAEKLSGHPYYLTHGTADSVVPLSEHSEKFHQLLPQTVFLERIENGGHDVQNFSYYGTAVEKAFADHADYFA